MAAFGIRLDGTVMHYKL